MKRLLLFLFAVALIFVCVSAPQAAPAQAGGRFMTVAVEIDPKGQPLAAWQVEVSGVGEEFMLVGLEGGEGAFDAPPFYDPKAMDGKTGRVVLAQFSLNKAKQLPRQAATVAVMHAFVKGQPKVGVKLVVATDENGKAIGASCALKIKQPFFCKSANVQAARRISLG